MCLASVALAGCRSSHDLVAPSIEFSRLPPAGEGNGEFLQTIAGRVAGAKPGDRIVLFAHSGMWWIQPVWERPFTAIQPDSTWTNSTHPGVGYAAVLVDGAYKPPTTLNALPPTGGLVRAVAVAEGAMLEHEASPKLWFSGYEWSVRNIPGDPSGLKNQYDASNAWVDEHGFLHLRIQKTSDGWTAAQVDLTRSLGYGLYRFLVRDVSQLDPQLALTISSWDGSAKDQEMDIEISRWGDPAGRNAQYVMQPFYLAPNVKRFVAPRGLLTYSFDWQPGRVDFRTVRGDGSGARTDVVAEHAFTSGVPPAGRETIRVNLYVFDNKLFRLEHGTEVIIEKFEYLP